MSSNLVWEPVNRNKGNLSDELKFALRKQYGEPIRLQMCISDINYLKGLVHGGVEDAQSLIDAIEKYEYISVMEQY